MGKKAGNILLAIGGFIGGFSLSSGLNFKYDFMEKDLQMINQMKRGDRNAALLEVFSKWMILKQNGKSLEEYFAKKGYNNIAIYGMHHLGLCILNELRESKIQVRYAIDRNAQNMDCDVTCITPGSNLGNVDVVVVTPIFSYFEIEENLKSKVKCPIISFEDIIIDMQ